MLKHKFINTLPSFVNTLSILPSQCFVRVQIKKFTVGATKSARMPNCDFVPSTYNGASYGDIKRSYESMISPSLKLFYKEPLLIHEGRGQWLWDHTGKRYLDMFGGIATVSVGHSHPKIVAAISEQSSKLNHVSSIYMHPNLYEYVRKLLAKFTGKLKVVYLTNSGSEANELAFLMARLHTGKQNIISLRNGYHGGTYASSAATAMSTWKYSCLQPPGFLHSIYPDVYKGTWGGSKCRDSPVQVAERICECCNDNCAASDNYFSEFGDLFKFSLPCEQTVAAFISEAIQGIGGVVQYPKSFLKKVYQHIHQKGGLCIADEVQTGFGRTGEHFWGFENHDVVPDIVTMAKGIGNGFPLGAVVTTVEVAKSLNTALHFNTFGGNPIACVIGSTVLNIIEEEDLQNNARMVGTHLLNCLSTLLTDFPNIVGDVRGKGLMIGVELISNAGKTKELESERMLEIFEDIKNMGVLLGKGGMFANVLRIKPPMCISKQDAEFTFDVIKKALQKHQDKYLRSEGFHVL